MKTKSKVYPLEIEVLMQHASSEGGYFSKGHQDIGAFVADVFDAYQDQINPEAVEHTMWRCVPWWEDGECVGHLFLDTIPGRGAFPVTYIWTGYKNARLDEEPVRVGVTAPTK